MPRYVLLRLSINSNIPPCPPLYSQSLSLSLSIFTITSPLTLPNSSDKVKSISSQGQINVKTTSNQGRAKVQSRAFPRPPFPTLSIPSPLPHCLLPLHTPSLSPSYINSYTSIPQ